MRDLARMTKASTDCQFHATASCGIFFPLQRQPARNRVQITGTFICKSRFSRALQASHWSQQRSRLARPVTRPISRLMQSVLPAAQLRVQSWPKLLIKTWRPAHCWAEPQARCATTRVSASAATETNSFFETMAWRLFSASGHLLAEDKSCRKNSSSSHSWLCRLWQAVHRVSIRPTQTVPSLVRLQVQPLPRLLAGKKATSIKVPQSARQAAHCATTFGCANKQILTFRAVARVVELSGRPDALSGRLFHVVRQVRR